MAKRLIEYMEEEENDSRIGEPLKLNIYDLTCINGYLYWAGLGAYHSAIEAYGTEYTYGAHDYPTSGVFEVKPRQYPGFQFRRSIIVGTIWIDVRTLQDFIEELACEYTGESYNLIHKNCNHFCNDVCMRLVGVPVPSWVNRLAKLGSICTCLIPDSFQIDGSIRCLDYESYNDSDSDSDSDDMETIQRRRTRRLFRGLMDSLVTVVPKRNLLRSVFRDTMVLSRLRRRSQV